MNKEELRAQLRQARLEMAERDVLIKSEVIASRALHDIDWSVVKNLHIYNSVDDWHEVDTKELIRKIEQFWPQVRISSPPIDRGNPIPTQRFDVIIVPVLGFDHRHHRLGLGGGWYDKFLVTQPDALKVGLAYEAALINEGIPREAHDIRLDKIITELKTY